MDGGTLWRAANTEGDFRYPYRTAFRRAYSGRAQEGSELLLIIGLIVFCLPFLFLILRRMLDLFTERLIEGIFVVAVRQYSQKGQREGEEKGQQEGEEKGQRRGEEQGHEPHQLAQIWFEILDFLQTSQKGQRGGEGQGHKTRPPDPDP